MSALRVEFTKYFNKPKICTRYFLRSSPHPPSSLCSLSSVFLSWRRLYLLALWVDSSKAYKILLCPATSFQFPAGQAHSGKHTHCRTPTHTHIHSPAYIFIACLQGNLKNATHQNLASLLHSHICRSLSLSLSPSNARLLSSLDCSCNGIFMQNNCLLSTAQRDTEHAQPEQAARQAGRQAGRAEFSWLQFTIEARRSGGVGEVG